MNVEDAAIVLVLTWAWSCSAVGWAGAGAVAEDAWRATDPVVQACNRGVALMGRYEYPEAVKAFEEALKGQPDSVELRLNLAIAIFNRSAKGDVEQAEKLLDEIIRDRPEEARAGYFRGIIHQYSGRNEQAIACFERVLALLPHEACTWYLLARSKAHSGQAYRTELERAAQENPYLASAYYDLMRLAAQERDPEKVRTYQEKFEKLRQHALGEMVVLPEYGQMGPLALVRPLGLPPEASPKSPELSAGAVQTLWRAAGTEPLRGPDATERRSAAGAVLAAHGIQPACADVNGDGRLDWVAPAVVREGRRGLVLLLGQLDGGFSEATEASGLTKAKGAVSCAFGDFDNDEKVDLFVCCAGPNYLFRGRGDGTFEDVTEKTRTAGGEVVSVSAVFLDADHDGDLDIYVCNAASTDGTAPAGNQLLNNNADGTFTDIAEQAGIACRTERSVMVVPADLDGDRDTDLVIFNEAAAARVFFNDRGGQYHEAQITVDPIRGDRGGVVQDFNGDGRPDVLVLPGLGVPGRLYLAEGAGVFRPSAEFEECVRSIGPSTRPSASSQPGTGTGDGSPGIPPLPSSDVTATDVADVDLDGDLDIVVLGLEAYVLRNDGQARFTVRKGDWPPPWDDTVIGTDVADFTGDGVPDLLRLRASGNGGIEVVPTKLTPTANWLAVAPTGTHSEDKRTRSSTSGYGTRIELRCGLHRQVLLYTGTCGGLSQSQRPVVFGLNGAIKPDYVAFAWPDGVTQSETELTGAVPHRVNELDRRKSSCPVLFAWNGERFGFVGDFAGVGGLGYFAAPGQYAAPQVLELVKITAEQLVARDGVYELRVCEPMEEVVYMDRLELLAVDHPREFGVFPDERLTLTGAPPTHRLLCPAKPIFPVKATGPEGTDGADRLREVDRRYAYEPKLDRRFHGFSEPHSLVLEFAQSVARSGGVPARRHGAGPCDGPGDIDHGPGTIRQDGPGTVPPDAERNPVVHSGENTPRVYLFVNGWIEYPYSQTTFAAAQAGVQWQPLMVERLSPDGGWETLVPDAGAPGGMARTLAIDLTGKLPAGACTLRLSTNLEIYIDQVFLAADRGTDGFAMHGVLLREAKLRRLGFPAEISPDGRRPTIYTYDVIAPTAPFGMPAGAYTRFGPVDELLSSFDDRYVIFGSGDEIALRFDAEALPPPGEGRVRSFILVSHAYCKDMDLYTGTPDTVEPLPFQGMSRYPYPAHEYSPRDEALRRYREEYNTRWRR